jgi:hypothetical protein
MSAIPSYRNLCKANYRFDKVDESVISAVERDLVRIEGGLWEVFLRNLKACFGDCFTIVQLVGSF